ncbi:anti-sigma factor antagonist [candidate division KSB1 bacterium]|nr:MAG: anti-sigma factor antagonist [candidate division KSB1 bacterium]MBC6948575.1 anti-sigma factor antagonist [candidate division KSB1 bacterium]MCE7942822.1 anti-sigma factor antagonist [Chlorobi bacterium CHB1]MDL1873761.1 STAS domain-containing protein [Cytophagia bacterium CHB2]
MLFHFYSAEQMMYCETRHENKVLIVSIASHETHFALAHELRTTVFQHIDNGERRMLVDLSRCEFIDSTFLGVLVGSAKKMNAAQGEFKLAGLGRNVRRLLQLTNLNRVFEAYENRQEALAAFYNCREVF